MRQLRHGNVLYGEETWSGRMEGRCGYWCTRRIEVVEVTDGHTFIDDGMQTVHWTASHTLCVLEE